MRETPKLLVGVVSVGLLTVSMVLLSQPDRRSSVESAKDAAGEPVEATQPEDAPVDVQAVTREPLPQKRVALGTAPVEAFVRPEAGRAGVVPCNLARCTSPRLRRRSRGRAHLLGGAVRTRRTPSASDAG